MKTKILALTVLVVLLNACGNKDKKGSENQATTAEETIKVPVFNADSAYAFVEKQVSFGPRVPGTDAHLNCRDWLAAQLERYGAKVTVQNIQVRTYNGLILSGYNIIGSINPEAKTRIMLSSHWDSRPYADWDPDVANHNKPIPGANDGASGVGVLLEIARVMQQTKPTVGIDIFFWDVEDYGEPKDAQGTAKEDTWGLGSQFWSKNPHVAGYSARYGILLDMVGAKNATFYQEGFSKNFASSIVSKVWNHADALGFAASFISTESNPIMDDHYYVNKYANIPTIDIIHQDKNSQTGFYPYWHTLNDDMSQIDKGTLNMVGQVLLRTAFYEK